MYAWSAQGFIYFCWLNSNKRIIAEVFAIRKNRQVVSAICKREKIYNHYYPVPKTRKKPGAGGLRVRRASATMWENLNVPKSRRTGQAKCLTHWAWGALSRESIKLSWRIAPVPARRGFGTLRFSMLFAAARHAPLPPAPGGFRPF